MKQRYILIFLVCAFVVLFFPVNRIYLIKDNYGQVRMSRVDRRAILASYGIYLTPGTYTNLFTKPDPYIKPQYVSYNPFDTGCFDLMVEFGGDTIVVYMGTPCVSENLTAEFRLERLPAFGPRTWTSIQEDRSGKYISLDCDSDK
ncbi:MAG: hypothetical protein QM762_26495 [Chryseolinea sp.]